MIYNKVINNRDEIINNISLSDVNKVLSNISLDNKSILKIKGE